MTWIISVQPKRSNDQSAVEIAPSVAKPCPQRFRTIDQPISVPGQPSGHQGPSRPMNLGLTITPLKYAALLTVSVVISFAMVIASTALGGYMVEIANKSSSYGRLTSVRDFMQQFSFVVMGPVGGSLAGIAFG